MTLLGVDRVGALSWRVVSCDQVVRVCLGGDLDAYTAPVLDEQVGPLLGIGAQVVVDLGTLRFCGCAGLSLFLRWRTSAVASGGSLFLVSAPRDARRAIVSSGLGPALPLVAGAAEVVCTVPVGLEEPRAADQR
jgi:anti-anti-sigma factor